MPTRSLRRIDCRAPSLALPSHHADINRPRAGHYGLGPENRDGPINSYRNHTTPSASKLVICANRGCHYDWARNPFAENHCGCGRRSVCISRSVRRLADLVQPYRLRLAELGEEMLGSGDLTPGRERQIRFYLDNAFTAGSSPVAALAVPFVAIFGLTASLAGRRPPRVIEQDDRTFLLFALSVFAAKPAFGTIVV